MTIENIRKAPHNMPEQERLSRAAGAVQYEGFTGREAFP
jgi:hypothetical protein